MENNPSSDNGAAPELARHWNELGNNARGLVDESRALVANAGAALDLRGRVERHPYGTLLAAAGIGYVLGGGLLSPLTWRVVQVALFPLVRQQVLPLLLASSLGSDRPAP